MLLQAYGGVLLYQAQPTSAEAQTKTRSCSDPNCEFTIWRVYAWQPSP